VSARTGGSPERAPRWSVPMADAVSALEWCSDGSGVAAGSCAGDVVVLTEEGEPAWPLEEHGAGVLCLSWSPDGCRLAVGGEDATVRTWGRDGTAVRVALRGEVNALAWAPSSDRLAVAGGCDVLVVTPDGSLVADHPWQAGTVNDVAWSPDGGTLVAATLGAVVWFESSTGRFAPARTSSVVGAALAVSFSPSGSLLAGGQLSGELALLQRDSGLGTVLTRYDGGVAELAWGRDGRQLAVAAPGEVDVWTLRADGSVEGPPTSFSGPEGTAARLSFEPAGTTLAAGGHGGELRLWDSAAGTPASYGVGSEVTALAWAPSGRRLAVGTKAGELRCYEWPEP